MQLVYHGLTMARSPLFARLRRWLNSANKTETKPSRRAFLRTAAAMPLAIPSQAAAVPRAAIVGGGVAGLYAAWLLKRAGLEATVYESSKRHGGRMYSATDLLAPGITTELGGEFIDTGHTEILGLARHFKLDLIDTRAPEEQSLQRDAFLFGGALRSEAEILAGFGEVAPRLKRDITASASTDGRRRLDRMALAEYLDKLGASGWIRSLLDVAFVTEYGLDAGFQSAMNLLSLIAPETTDLKLFGESDERYKILGGNQRITDGLASDLSNQVLYEHRLEAIAPDGTGYRLTFQRPASSPAEVKADVVLLALPFSILRRISMRVPLPTSKRLAIYELGYGTHTKLMFGVQQRIWRKAGYGGNLFTDEPFQLAWDSSRRQPGEAGGMTLLCGGKRGIDAGTGETGVVLDQLIPSVEKAWPGILDARNGKTARFSWPSHPHTLASYSCYRPGQWTSLRGQEFKPVGRLHFAGEHTSTDFQGFMEGGAETGKRTAKAILRQAGMRSTF